MTTTSVEVFRAWRLGHPAADQTKCPSCLRPKLGDDRSSSCLHADGCEYMEWCAEDLDTIDVMGPDCSCDKNGLWTLGSAESIRACETDPYCTDHGLPDVVSGAYAAMSEIERRAFDRKLARGMRDLG